MSDPATGTETTIPILPCVDPEATLAFYGALGFVTTYEMRKPYLYLAFRRGGCHLHFVSAPDGFDPARETAGSCLVMVDAVAPYHAVFSAALRAASGRVPAKGVPRITRYRPGASRFTIVDPSGNALIFVQRDEPVVVEYGGSASLAGLAKVIDNARIFREFKMDDRAAAKVLVAGLRKFPDAPALDQALAIAELMELAAAADDPARLHALTAQLEAVALPAEDRQRIAARLGDVANLETWLRG